jgi:hypothetical protein
MRCLNAIVSEREKIAVKMKLEEREKVNCEKIAIEKVFKGKYVRL